jgi:ribonuclease P protein component
MGFERGWRRWPADGFWRRAGRKAASAFPRDAAVSRSPSNFVGRKLETLKVRADFLRVAGGGRRSAGPGLVVQAAPRAREQSGTTEIRVGFTASRKVGNAVVRNRAKRRMRAAAASVLPALGRPGTDYVLIARAGTADRPFAELIADLEAALRRIGRPSAPKPSAPGAETRSAASAGARCGSAALSHKAPLSHEAPGEAH